MNRQKKSIDIGKFLIVQHKNELMIYNGKGEGMNLTTRSIEKLEKLFDAFFEENFGF